jgi:uncharacterized membrane protein
MLFDTPLFQIFIVMDNGFSIRDEAFAFRLSIFSLSAIFTGRLRWRRADLFHQMNAAHTFSRRCVQRDAAMRDVYAPLRATPPQPASRLAAEAITVISSDEYFSPFSSMPS